MSAIATITLVFGVLLNLIGLYGFLGTGAIHPIALLPCALGVLLGACTLASTDPKLHRQAMQGASLVALFGFVANVSAFRDLLLVLKKVTVSNQSEIIACSATSLLCLILLTRYFQEFLVSRSRKKE
jgi:hypothetical protein